MTPNFRLLNVTCDKKPFLYFDTIVRKNYKTTKNKRNKNDYTHVTVSFVGDFGYFDFFASHGRRRRRPLLKYRDKYAKRTRLLLANR